MEGNGQDHVKHGKLSGRITLSGVLQVDNGGVPVARHQVWDDWKQKAFYIDVAAGKGSTSVWDEQRNDRLIRTRVLLLLPVTTMEQVQAKPNEAS